ncbi:unnamed protein product, partial [Rotaria sordida]
MPNPDSLVERFLRSRFELEIVGVQIAAFNVELLAHGEELRRTIEERQRPETEKETSELNEKMANVRQNLTEKYLGKMIQSARYEIFGLDKKQSTKDFRSLNEQQEAAKQLPTSIQKELIEIEKKMNKYREPEELIEKTRSIMRIVDDQRREKEQKELKKQAEIETKIAIEKKLREQRINM